MKKTIIISLLVIFIVIFAFSAYKIISVYTEYDEGEETYKEISEEAVVHSDAPVFLDMDEFIKGETERNEDRVPMITAEGEPALTLDREALYAQNKDIIGWIYCPDTAIDYPVLKSKDNDYYLRRMADKKYNIAGSIFMDYRNQGDFTDVNTLIYGHNMKNGTMFSDIVKYKDRSYYDAHPYIYYSTPEKDYLFKVFAAATVDTKDRIFSEFESREELHEYFTESENITLFDTDTDLLSIDNTVTMSTCANDSGSKRYLVFCIPAEIVYSE